MRSFSCLTIRARDGAPLFRIGEIFRCHSGGCSQSLVRDTGKIPSRVRRARGPTYLAVPLPFQFLPIGWIWWFALRS
jgi:hypothetical protein